MHDAPKWLIVDRLWVDGEGETHFRQCRIPDMGIQPSINGEHCVFTSVPVPVDHMSIRIIPAGTNIHHNAPERRLVAILAGVMQVTVSDGTARQWRAGEMMLATDTGQGKGHRTQAIGGQVLTVVAKLPESLNLEDWTI